MGAIALLGGLSAASTYMQGRAQKQAYDAEARQAGMTAEAQEIDRRRALNDALAVQAVMFGAQGRTPGVGSTAAIQTEDIKRATQDISLIRAGARVRQADFQRAGQYAQIGGTIGGLSKMGTSLYTASQIGGKAKK